MAPLPEACPSADLVVGGAPGRRTRLSGSGVPPRTASPFPDTGLRTTRSVPPAPQPASPFFLHAVRRSVARRLGLAREFTADSPES
ncbi:hypothetical protein SAMN00790413_04041 [Deinococcus hopiensis KR-140]|uniref:Uncharacterized protein n=1 Tax=Deinococcus hopiensis KR-140 TaxID=695939 RepID=A0A1W1UND8_9DEIO|nr:hypothetical protein SAMN00790413_04041 [Deinococcus hopiensis KR-140]